MKRQVPSSTCRENSFLSSTVSLLTCGLYFLLTVTVSWAQGYTQRESDHTDDKAKSSQVTLLPTSGQHPWISSQAGPLPLRPQTQPSHRSTACITRIRLLLCHDALSTWTGVGKRLTQLPSCSLNVSRCCQPDAGMATALPWYTWWACPSPLHSCPGSPHWVQGCRVTGNGKQRPLVWAARSGRLRTVLGGGVTQDGEWAPIHELRCLVGLHLRNTNLKI